MQHTQMTRHMARKLGNALIRRRSLSGTGLIPSLLGWSLSAALSRASLTSSTLSENHPWRMVCVNMSSFKS